MIEAPLDVTCRAVEKLLEAVTLVIVAVFNLEASVQITWIPLLSTLPL